MLNTFLQYLNLSSRDLFVLHTSHNFFSFRFSSFADNGPLPSPLFPVLLVPKSVLPNLSTSVLLSLLLFGLADSPVAPDPDAPGALDELLESGLLAISLLLILKNLNSRISSSTFALE